MPFQAQLAGQAVGDLAHAGQQTVHHRVVLRRADVVQVEVTQALHGRTAGPGDVGDVLVRTAQGVLEAGDGLVPVDQAGHGGHRQRVRQVGHRRLVLALPPGLIGGAPALPHVAHAPGVLEVVLGHALVDEGLDLAGLHLLVEEAAVGVLVAQGVADLSELGAAVGGVQRQLVVGAVGALGLGQEVVAVQRPHPADEVVAAPAVRELQRADLGARDPVVHRVVEVRQVGEHRQVVVDGPALELRPVTALRQGPGLEGLVASLVAQQRQGDPVQGAVLTAPALGVRVVGGGVPGQGEGKQQGHRAPPQGSRPRHAAAVQREDPHEGVVRAVSRLHPLRHGRLAARGAAGLLVPGLLGLAAGRQLDAVGEAAAHVHAGHGEGDAGAERGDGVGQRGVVLQVQAAVGGLQRLLQVLLRELLDGHGLRHGGRLLSGRVGVAGEQQEREHGHLCRRMAQAGGSVSLGGGPR